MYRMLINPDSMYGMQHMQSKTNGLGHSAASSLAEVSGRKRGAMTHNAMILVYRSALSRRHGLEPRQSDCCTGTLQYRSTRYRFHNDLILVGQLTKHST